MSKKPSSIINRIVFPGFRNFLGSAIAALSVISLISSAFEIGWTPVFAQLIDIYDGIVDFFFGWAGPIVEKFFAWIGFPIILYDHWKHIILLLGLYFFAGARIDFAVRGIRSGILRLLLGFLLAAGTGIWTGTIPLSEGDLNAHVMIALVPAFATLVNDVVLRATRVLVDFNKMQAIRKRPDATRLSYFLEGIQGIFFRTLLCAAVIFAGVRFPAIQQLASPGLALLALVMLIHAINLIQLGVKEVKFLRQDGDTWEQAYLRSPGALIGLAMVSVVLNVVVVLILNAGSKLLPF